MTSNVEEPVSRTESDYPARAASWYLAMKKTMDEDAELGISADIPEGDVFHVDPTEAS